MYDVIIIGAGPAGLAAAQHAHRYGLETLLLEKENIGGELINRHDLENYPGFPDGISGTDLRAKLVDELEAYDPEVKLAAVEEIEPGPPHAVRTGSSDYRARTVILATGGRHGDLGVPGEDRYDGRGIFYCAQCDGPLYRDEEIAVVGSDTHAVTDALFLTEYASSVTIVTRDDRLAVGEHLRADVESNPDLEVLYDTEVTAVEGEDHLLEALELVDGATGEERTLAVGGLYVCTGIEPNTEFLEGVVSLTDDGAVAVDSALMTDVDGIFAAGDVRQHAGREVAASVGDGVTAANSAARYVDRDEPSGLE